MTPKRIVEIVKTIPKECSPRLGGSCSLYFRGLVDSYRDVDIIINKGTLDKINLPFPKIELQHEGINKRIKYCIDGREVDILESLFYVTRIEKSTMGIYFEVVEDVLEAKKMIDNYLEYDKNI